MKEIVKKLRSFVPINYCIRNIIKFFIWLGFNLKENILQHIPVSGIVNISLPNKEKFKLYSKADDYIPSQAYWKGFDGYEYSISPFYFLALNSDTIIDIGANIGYYSIIASRANPLSQIYSFEPVSRIVKRFEKQIDINNISNIRIEEMIVGDKTAKVSFYIPKGETMALAASTKKGWVSNVEKVSVNSIRLDDYKKSNNIKKVNLIKMDCEFHELEVLKGMSGILITDKPTIIMEVLFPESKEVKGHFEGSQYQEIEKLMIKNNYFFYIITKMHLKKVDRLIHNSIDRNYVFSVKDYGNGKILFSDL